MRERGDDSFFSAPDRHAMNQPSATLAAILRAIPRRYRSTARPAPGAVAQPDPDSPIARLARAIEPLQAADASAQAPDGAVRDAFIDALAALIDEALRPDAGDPVFQGALQEYRHPVVREYLELRHQEAADQRQLRAAINTVAHPAKPPRLAPGAGRESLARLHAEVSSGSWQQAAQTAQALLNLPQVHTDADLASALRALLDAPALARLQRLDALASDPRVRQYEAIREKQGPRSGSEEANAQGLLARQRGVAVEILAARALEALARHLDQASPSESRHGDASPGYRVVTSLRVPSALAANADRAKTEWDAVLLRRADGNANETPLWDVCLLIEAKASVDAATTDLPRLLRGLRLLAQAEPDASYSCATQQGQVRLRGASLRALPQEMENLADAVLYCCDAPDETWTPALNAASRMQLLSAPPSLAYAALLAAGEPADARMLEPLWQDLRQNPRWQAMLNLGATRRLARELMVHPDDLLASINA